MKVYMHFGSNTVADRILASAMNAERCNDFVKCMYHQMHLQFKFVDPCPEGPDLHAGPGQADI